MLICLNLSFLLIQIKIKTIENRLIDKEINEFDGNNLKNAGFWVLSTLAIDNDGGGNYTWEQAKAEAWCSGSGTHADPYVIENVTINGNNLNSCLIIRDSNVYFRIENCTLLNSSKGIYDAGLQLYNVTNGSLIDNDCSSNSLGIRLSSTNNMTIQNNVANFNTQSGIYQENSNSNTFSGNTANNNSENGIFLRNSNYNTISGNTIKYNDLAGIILDYCTFNNLSGNTANYNDINGISLEICDNNTITGNNIKYNQEDGIFLRSSNNNTVTGNTIVYNSNYKCVYQLHCADNTVSNTCTSFSGTSNGDGNGDGNGNGGTYEILGFPIEFIFMSLMIGFGASIIEVKQKKRRLKRFGGGENEE